MATQTMGTRTDEFIVMEGPSDYSRKVVTIAASQTIKKGTVLGRVTSGGQYVAVAPAADNGSQTAVAVALKDATTGSGQTAQIPVLVRHCIVSNGTLDWKALNSSQQTAAKTQLENVGIVVREVIG